MEVSWFSLDKFSACEVTVSRAKVYVSPGIYIAFKTGKSSGTLEDKDLETAFIGGNEQKAKIPPEIKSNARHQACVKINQIRRKRKLR